MESVNTTRVNDMDLIYKHAQLATDFAKTDDTILKQEISEKLRKIEEELEMSPEEIASKALSTYSAKK